MLLASVIVDDTISKECEKVSWTNRAHVDWNRRLTVEANRTQPFLYLFAHTPWFPNQRHQCPNNFKHSIIKYLRLQQMFPSQLVPLICEWMSYMRIRIRFSLSPCHQRRFRCRCHASSWLCQGIRLPAPGDVVLWLGGTKRRVLGFNC